MNRVKRQGAAPSGAVTANGGAERPSARRGWKVAAAAALASGFLVTSASVEASNGRAQRAPSAAQCNNRNNNTQRKLLECVNVEGVRQHQSVLQFIADANGGTRSAGTPGYDASVDSAVRIFKNAG